MRLNREVKGLLKKVGARLKRSKKHLVFETAEGKNIVLSHTPSDRNAYKNQVRAIKSHIQFDQEPEKPKVIREKRSKPGRHGEERVRPAPPPNDTMAQQLRQNGVVEESLRHHIAMLQLQLKEVEQIALYLANERDKCWFCRLRKWWKSTRTGRRTGVSNGAA